MTPVSATILLRPAQAGRIFTPPEPVVAHQDASRLLGKSHVRTANDRRRRVAGHVESECLPRRRRSWKSSGGCPISRRRPGRGRIGNALTATERVMKLIATSSVALVLALAPAACQRQEAQPSTSDKPAATTQSDAKATAALTPQQITQRTVQRRAVEVVSWGMPAVNFDLMYQAMAKLGGHDNQIVYWSGLPDWKNQTLTPNPDSIYLMPFFNTKDVGPVVLEIPPADEGSITGSIMDCWQTALEDVGPAGVDKGKGGKYLILPPDHKDPVPAGYIALPSGNYQGYALLRSILKSGSKEDVAKAVAYARRIKLYPLSQAANPPSTTFVDAIGSVFDATIPYDRRFFESLNRMVQAEPWLARDRAMIDLARSVGIEKGKPYKPDAQVLATLDEAAQEARSWMESHYVTLFSPPYYDGAQWAVPMQPELAKGLQSNFADPDSYPIDARGVTYSYAFFSAKHFGAGQFYLMTLKDKQGRFFDGSKTYRLTVPANAPVTQYWSATVYDRATHALIRDLRWSSRSSQTPGLKKNGDGSANVYFSPNVPAEGEGNWVPTKAGGSFEVLFRLYGPQKPLYDKTWKLPDIEEI
ncbi:DUF1254 domain-containing protein [Lysobacter rhizosphaerae]